MYSKHTISVLLENKTGALARIAGLFSGRGYNIESLSVSPTQDQSLSKMTIVTYGDDDVFEQIDKQLNKLVNVKEVEELTIQDHVNRELMLIKIEADRIVRNDVLSISSAFNGKVINIGKDSIIIELTGGAEKLDAFLELVKDYNIIDLVRTGRVALSR